MAPTDSLLASNLLTSHESKSAYKVTKSVKISEEAPIIFTDVNHNNDPIIDYNALCQATDVEVPPPILQYAKKPDYAKLVKHMQSNNQAQSANHVQTKQSAVTAAAAMDDECVLEPDSNWQREFELKAELEKDALLQHHNEKYRDIKFEYDELKRSKHGHKQKTPLLHKILTNAAHKIKVKAGHEFESVVQHLKQSNPHLFADYQHEKLMRENESQSKQHKMKKNIARITGYNEVNEIELLSVNPENIKQCNNDLNLEQLLQRNMCDWDNQIIIDDNVDAANHSNQSIAIYDEQSNNGTDEQLSIGQSLREIQLQPNNIRPDETSLLAAKCEQRAQEQQLQALIDENASSNNATNPSKKRKHRDDDSDSDDILFGRTRKKRKSITFKISNTTRQQYRKSSDKNSNRNSSQSGKAEDDDDDIELMLPSNPETPGNEAEYDEDAIGDDLFDMMPDFEDDYGAANNMQFGTVQDDLPPEESPNNHVQNSAVDEQKQNAQQADSNKMEVDSENNHNAPQQAQQQQAQPQQQQQAQRVRKVKRLPIQKCAQNNSSIWPNRNKEYEACDWLDSVIICDDQPPKRDMNTNLIIDLNDHRMEWTEDFIKNMTKICQRAAETKDDDFMQDREKSESVETRYSVRRWNMSNDAHYSFDNNSEAKKRNLHTPMAYRLDPCIFPLAMEMDEWVNLHRKRVKLDLQSINDTSVKILNASKTPKQRSEERMKDIRNKFSLYVPKDLPELSGAHDRVILLEYLEQYPLIIQSAGMTSNITTFYRRTQQEYDQELEPPDITVDDGTVKILEPKQKSPLLGAPKQSKVVTVIDNKLYIAPIWSHTKTLNIHNYTNYGCSNNDDATNNDSNEDGKDEEKSPQPKGNNLFLLVGQDHTYHIRKIDGVFSVGQIQPKKVVYHPGSRKFYSYVHNRCKVHIYRLLRSKPTVSINEIAKEFILESEDTIKNTLATVASHDKSNAAGPGQWERKPDFFKNRTDEELTQYVSPEQEVLRQMFMNCFCRLVKAGISPQLLGGSKGGSSWKRVLKNLVFSKDLIDNMDAMKKELEQQKIEWDKKQQQSGEDNKMNKPAAPRLDFDDNKDDFLMDTNPTLKLKALTLIEELIYCTSWYISDQFLRCLRGEGEMQLTGYGNPFKDGEGFNYLRDKEKTSGEAIKLMVQTAGSRANTKADFRRMPIAKARAILQQRYFVPESVLEKLDRRKIMELLQKKSRDAVSAGSQNKTALRYARLTGSRKTFARNQYLKKIKKLMTKHLYMLRGGHNSSKPNQAKLEDDIMNDLDDVLAAAMTEGDNNKNNNNGNNVESRSPSILNANNMSQDRNRNENGTQKKKKKYKLKCVKKYKLRYTYTYNDPITGERKKEIEEYTDAEMLRKYKLCIKEGDRKFIRLKQYSKLHQMQQALEAGGGPPAFMKDKEKERWRKMESIRTMPPEEREKKLKFLEGLKPYITCSSCKRKGHNANNKYCPDYFTNREKKQERNKSQSGNNDDAAGNDDGAAAIDVFIDRAIKKKHKKIRNPRSKRRNKKLPINADKGPQDPMMDLMQLFKVMMDHITKAVPGYKTFASDPTLIPNYSTVIKEPMCLDWIDENIEFTIQWIQQPHPVTEHEASRGKGKPLKKKYETFDMLMQDILLIRKNCEKFNGPASKFTKDAIQIVNELNGQKNKYKQLLESIQESMKGKMKVDSLHPIMERIIGGILAAPSLAAVQSLKNLHGVAAGGGDGENALRGYKDHERVLGLYEIRQKAHDKHYRTFGEFVTDLKRLQQFCWQKKREQFEKSLKLLPKQFAVKLEPYKSSLLKIDPGSAEHFVLNERPPFI